MRKHRAPKTESSPDLCSTCGGTGENYERMCRSCGGSGELAVESESFEEPYPDNGDRDLNVEFGGIET